jgi:hypothetical protein
MLQCFGELSRARLLGFEQARVLDGDDRLCGEVLYELNLLFGERAYLLPVNGEDTDQLFILENRYIEEGSEASKLGGSQ